MRTRIKMLVALLSLVLATACGEDEHAPTLTMTADTDTIAPGGTITLNVAVTDFELTEHDDKPKRHGDGASGHLHVYLDDLMTEPVYMGVEMTITLIEGTTVGFDAPIGEHQLIGRLSDEGHRIIEPQITSTVSFTVE